MSERCTGCFKAEPERGRDLCQLCDKAGVWNLSAIVAMTRDGLLAVGSHMPWSCPQDMGRFRAVTRGKRVIMGRKTWDALPTAPLKDRSNVVVSRTAHDLTGAQVVSETDSMHYGLVMGGAEIYRLMMDRCKYLFVTWIPDGLCQAKTGPKVLFPLDLMALFPHTIVTHTGADQVQYETRRNSGR
jgi:dihydrofolate reductase